MKLKLWKLNIKILVDLSKHRGNHFIDFCLDLVKSDKGNKTDYK